MAKSAKKTNAIEYRVRVYNDGVQRYDGDILSMSDSGVMFRYQRRGSSAFEQRLIPRSKIVGITGSVGKRGTIMFHDRVVAFEIRRGSINNISPKTNLVDVSWLNTKSETQNMSVDVNTAEIIALNGVEKPSDELSAKKKKAGGSKKKKEKEKKS